MHSARTLFPGVMGPDGFISCFDHLIDDASLRRMIILKGGPGVGKSTFMRRLHAALCADGEPSTRYICSGDPDSLDAAAIDQPGILILDGTAPHVVDPRIPGARDSIVNLGECLNERAMQPQQAQIRACMAEHADASRRARAQMQAASVLLREAAQILASCADEKRMGGITHALTDAVLGKEEADTAVFRVRPVITDAVTHKGRICLLHEGDAPRVIRLVRREGMDLTSVLRSLSSAAQAAGLAVEEHLDPLCPGSLLHLTIPALKTLVTTHDLPAQQTFDFAACLSQSMRLRRECMLEQLCAAASGHIRAAVSALAKAKHLHDELEAFYVPNMDFDRWQTLYDNTLHALLPLQQ